jgi:hypothetical protein
MDPDVTLLRVRDGDLVAGGSWVYVWVKPAERARPVIYVGGTGLAPAVRTWLHLHDPDPDVGRIAARDAELARQPLDVLAFRVPEPLRRGPVKAEVTRRLHGAGMLSERYVGDPPGLPPAASQVDEPAELAELAQLADRIVAAVAAHGGGAPA